MAIIQTRINLFSSYYLIPFAFLAMMGSAIIFLKSIFSTNSRWLVIFSFLIIFILKKNFLRSFDAFLFIILCTYFGWCFLSLFWSEIPIISFMKSSIMAIVAFTLIRTGIEWVRINPITNALNYFWVIAFFSLLAGILGHFVSRDLTYNTIGFVMTYQGLVDNSNMFGILMSMSLPFLIWRAYKANKNIKERIFWLLLISGCLYWIMLSVSRSAILTSIFTLIGFLFSLQFNKKIKLFLLTCLISITMTLLFPSILDNFLTSSQQWIYKGNKSSLFYSREERWQQSYDAALDGGWTGFGYGISEGFDEFYFDQLLQGRFYGREKGNSQLAILEETGIIGFTLYLVLILFLVLKLFILFMRAKNPDLRVLVGILFGLFLGMVFHSGFEGWWDAPGSQESIYFWMLVGIIKGLEILNSNESDHYTASWAKT